MRIGFGRSDITPQVGVELCGFGWYLNRKSTGVVEPLYANAFVWQLGETKGAIISCDLLGVSKEITQQVRQWIAKDCNIPYDHILLCGTHSHSGPTTVDLIGWGEKDTQYLRELPRRIAEAATSACDRMAEATFEYGETRVDGISYNRESHGKDAPGGLTDQTLKVLKVNQNGKMIGCLSHYSCHPVVMCEETSLISGDFIGMAINKISARHGATCLFLQGSLGDQNPIYCHDKQDIALNNLQTLSEKFAVFIEKALANAKPISIDSASVKRMDIALPQVVIEPSMIVRNLLMAGHLYEDFDALPEKAQRRIRFERDVCEAVWKKYDEQPVGVLETELQAMQFGDLLMVAHPTELFYSYHVEIERRLAPRKVFVIGQANNSIGYIPTPDKYDVSHRKYSYPAWFTSYMYGELPFVRNIGDILTDEIIKLGKGLA